MRYLARWRIQVAAHHLRDSDAPLARIAELVGYESETALNRGVQARLRSAARKNLGIMQCDATWLCRASSARSRRDALAWHHCEVYMADWISTDRRTMSRPISS